MVSTFTKQEYTSVWSIDSRKALRVAQSNGDFEFKAYGWLNCVTDTMLFLCIIWRKEFMGYLNSRFTLSVSTNLSKHLANTKTKALAHSKTQEHYKLKKQGDSKK